MPTPATKKKPLWVCPPLRSPLCDPQPVALLRALQIEYLPLLDAWYVEEYRAQVEELSSVERVLEGPPEKPGFSQKPDF